MKFDHKRMISTFAQLSENIGGNKWGLVARLLHITMGPLTTSSVTMSTWLLRANNVLYSQCPLINYNVKKFSYKEHGATTSTFLCVKLLVVSGTQCMWTGLIVLTSDARAVLKNWVPSIGAR